MLDEPKIQEVPQPAAAAAPPASNRKWIVLAVGGGCAILACAGLVIVLAGAFFAPNVSSQFSRIISGAGGLQPTPLATSSVQQPGNTLGDPNAPVKIVEYADFQCPYCERYWRDTEPRIIEQYVKTGKVFYEYHSVGGFIGPESAAAAEAAYCAGDQGKFWQYHDTLFANWTGENVGDFSNDKLLQYAASVGLDEGAFSGCMSRGKYANRLLQDVADAKAAGIRGTPFFLINGKPLEGAQPFSVFQTAIEAALQGK